MTRRALLVRLVAAVALAGPAVSRPLDVLVRDCRLQQQVLVGQSLASAAREIYRKWLRGGLSTAAARSDLEAQRRGLEQCSRRAAALAVPAEQAWLARNHSHEQAEVRFFLAQLSNSGRSGDVTAELQTRWLSALTLRREWLSARRRRLPELLTLAGRAPVAAYYAWRQAVSGLELSELDLAQDLAEEFRSEDQRVPQWTRRALALSAKAEGIPAAASLTAARQAMLARFGALSRLCESATAYRHDPSADSVSNLQADEREFEKLASQSESVGLQVLLAMLGLR